MFTLQKKQYSNLQMYEMLVGQSPFHGEGEDELFDSILNERPYFPKTISKEAAKCLSAVGVSYFSKWYKILNFWKEIIIVWLYFIYINEKKKKNFQGENRFEKMFQGIFNSIAFCIRMIFFRGHLKNSES